MANTEMENPLGFVDKRHTQNDTGKTTGDIHASAGSASLYANVGALRAALATANGAYYTSTRLDQMTKNDMVYALRVANDPTGM